MATIEISAKLKGSNLDKITNLRKNFELRVGGFLKEVVDDSANFTNGIYAQGQQGKTPRGNADAGNYYAHAHGESTGKLSAKLIADGHDVLFFEYGAGDLTISPAEPGSYSSTKGSGEYYEHHFWHYNGQLFVGVYPVRPMYQAQKHSIEYIHSNGGKTFK